MLRLARSFAQRDNVILAPLELSLAFIELVSRRLGFRPGALRRLNANEPGLPATSPVELASGIGLINLINAREREFYGFVCRSFDEFRATHPRPASASGNLCW